MTPPPLVGRRVTVMGVGRFGGGLGAIRHLLDGGASVLATDRLDAGGLGRIHDQLERLAAATGRLELRLGGHRIEDFRHTDLVVANPAVPAPWRNPFLQASRDARVPVTTEIRLAIDALPNRRFIGVTGSVGKSSTASMIHHALERLGVPTALGGNIGGSLLADPERVPANAWVVLELSSFMLHWLANDPRPWSPDLAVLTTIRPNHLDWHLDVEHYIRSKAAILGPDRSTPLITAFEEDDPAAAASAAAAAGCWWTSTSSRFAPTLAALDPQVIELRVPGAHQRRNARLALAAVEAIHQLDGSQPPPQERLLASLVEFSGLPHRLAEVPMGSDAPIRWFNDSKATTPDATRLAVESLGDRSRIHLIAGGHDKGIDLAELASLAPSLAGLYAIGTTATRLATGPGIVLSGTLRQAIADIRPRLRVQDVVLLSPGCASWDQFRDYRARGEAFVTLASENGSVLQASTQS